MSRAAAPRVHAHDFTPDVESFRDDVLRGLALPQKEIPAKYFYDARGSELFEEICGLEEYYPTRTETALLRKVASEIADRVGPNAVLIEYGAGASQKVRILLDRLEATAAFIPIDISGEHLLQAAKGLAADYPRLQIVPVAADYTERFELPVPSGLGSAKKVVFFPGSTIGNFSEPEAKDFLKKSAALLAGGGEMIVGVDLKKDERVLLDAYNDAKGVTARFNLNLLTRINTEIGADFDLAAFEHHAPWNPEAGRIEMHLVSRVRQSVTVAGRQFEFAEGESIHTENSYKFTVGEFQDLARSAGFDPVTVWTDDRDLFSIHYLRAA